MEVVLKRGARMHGNRVKWRRIAVPKPYVETVGENCSFTLIMNERHELILRPEEKEKE